ncbi:serine/threonine protein kinase, partial [Beggiatoa alba]|nr:serine/threonine protein kinase [Beggiatoa alba]
YRSALSLTLDAGLESSLQTKIEQIRDLSAPQLVRPSASGDAAAASFETTVIVSPNANTQSRPLVASRYRIDAALGQGGMGLVHRAHDTVLDRDIALKQLAPALVLDTQFVDRFRQEALALARLSHPHIVQIYDYIEDRDLYGKKQVWIAMELVNGDELAAHMQPDALMPEQECLHFALQMSQAMAYAHEQGIVHRDFKPANVLITADGNCKIMDFGLAKIARSELHTQIGTVMGSPAFMSPEQAAGKNSDARSDIYALGITLYLMCSGRLPFMGDAQAMLAQHLSQTPPSPQEKTPAVKTTPNTPTITAAELKILDANEKKKNDDDEVHLGAESTPGVDLEHHKTHPSIH